MEGWRGVKERKERKRRKPLCHSATRLDGFKPKWAVLNSSLWAEVEMGRRVKLGSPVSVLAGFAQLLDWKLSCESGNTFLQS